MDPFQDPPTSHTERRQRRAAERARQQDADLEKLLATPEGRRFLWRVITAAGTFERSFAVEAASTAFNEGRRDVGIRLMQECQRVSPGLYLLMTQERIEAEAQQALDEKLAVEAEQRRSP